MNKLCFKCGDKKEIKNNFYKHPKTKDGYLNKCKGCTKKDNTINRRKRIKYYRDYDKKRTSLPHRIKARKDYQVKERKENPKKYLARQRAERALKRGKLIKEKCYFCKAKKVEIHHVDYSQPLKVYWMCIKCHRKFDKLAREMNYD